MMGASFRASLASIRGETTELRACRKSADRQMDRQTAFHLYIVDYIVEDCKCIMLFIDSGDIVQLPFIEISHIDLYDRISLLFTLILHFTSDVYLANNKDAILILG